MDPVLSQATASVCSGGSAPPDSARVAAALLTAEKAVRKQKQDHSMAQLIGTWRLCWISGTRRTQQQAGPLLGPGRYLPGVIKITLRYLQPPELNSEEQGEARGWVENQVELGGLRIGLSGPTRFLSRKSILAFDFTRIHISLLGRQLWQGDLRGGRTAEEKFYQSSIRDQAFFVYFLLEQELIAARGRGGGLALWGRIAD